MGLRLFGSTLRATFDANSHDAVAPTPIVQPFAVPQRLSGSAVATPALNREAATPAIAGNTPHIRMVSPKTFSPHVRAFKYTLAAADPMGVLSDCWAPSARLGSRIPQRRQRTPAEVQAMRQLHAGGVSFQEKPFFRRTLPGSPAPDRRDETVVRSRRMGHLLAQIASMTGMTKRG